nr:hypothetical protein [Tanacetum cinerariifolium]
VGRGRQPAAASEASNHDIGTTCYREKVIAGRVAKRVGRGAAIEAALHGVVADGVVSGRGGAQHYQFVLAIHY